MNARRIVIVGAGGSGVPLAARLGAHGHDVVLLEAGEAPPDVPAWTVRAGLPDTPTTWTYGAELTPGRAWRIARGRALGGSLAVNGAYFQRPDPDDFAAWAQCAGTEWEYDACLPALRRLEADRDFGHGRVHGDCGPVSVRRPDEREPITAAFLAGARAAGAAAQPDTNDGGAAGCGPLPRNADGPRREGIERAYGELLATGHVDIRTGVAVQTIRFRGRRAAGVDAIVDGRAEAIDADEVILAAGAVETPRLLLRSGIGDRGRCAPGVTVVAARRGVGRNLSDHAALDIAWRARSGATPGEGGAAWTAVWNAPADSIAARPTEILLAVLPRVAVLTGDAAADGPLDLRVTLAAPLSRGSVTLDRDVPVRYHHLAHAVERDSITAAARAAERILRSPEMADVVADVTTVPTADPRELIGTALHSCGTARIGPRDDPDAVVDAHGRVHDVEGLRIADTSLLPQVPRRGTALSAVLVGERIAELMAGE